MYYPITFQSVYKQMIWGGTRLRDEYARDTPFSVTGESWDISCRKDGMCIVSNGAHAGMAFRTLIKKDTEGILGAKFRNYPRFPLLVKLIDANDDLSVQVHPDDEYVKQHENYPQSWSPAVSQAIGETGAQSRPHTAGQTADTGKNEMWCIIDAEPDSRLIIGLKDGVTKNDFTEAINKGGVMQCLNTLPVKKGDIIDIPAGLVHAIGKGIVLAEIQQNSDLTYRVYDYDRIGFNGEKRALHLDKALDCIDFSGKLPKEPVTPRVIIEHEGAAVCDCIKKPYFSVQLLNIKTHLALASNPEAFHIITVTQGNMYIEHTCGAQNVGAGTSVLIPAALGEYTVSGVCRALYCTV